MHYFQSWFELLYLNCSLKCLFFTFHILYDFIFIWNNHSNGIGTFVYYKRFTFICKYTYTYFIEKPNGLVTVKAYVNIKRFPKLNSVPYLPFLKLDRLVFKLKLHLMNCIYTQYETLRKIRYDLLWLPTFYEKINLEDTQKLVCSIIYMVQWDIYVHNSYMFLSHLYKFWKLYIHLCVRKMHFIAQLFFRLV